MSSAVADWPLPSRPWTVDDLAATPVDRRRRELIDGVLLMGPSPPMPHQVVMGRLGAVLDETCPDDFSVTIGVDVMLSRTNVVCPDVLVTTAEAAQRRIRNYEAHEVLLAVEVVSDTSQAMDRILKPTLYAESGIPCYWRIELTDRVTVHAYELRGAGDVYTHVGQFTDTVEVGQPWPITIPVKQLTPRFLRPSGQ